MVSWPFGFRTLFKLGGVLEHLRPSLLAVFQKETCVEVDAAADVQLGSRTVLMSDLNVSSVTFQSLMLFLAHEQ